MDIISLLILAAVIAAAWAAVRYLKRHGVGCGGDCAHCSQNCSRRPPDEHPKP